MNGSKTHLVRWVRVLAVAGVSGACTAGMPSGLIVTVAGSPYTEHLRRGVKRTGTRSPHPAAASGRFDVDSGSAR